MKFGEKELNNIIGRAINKHILHESKGLIEGYPKDNTWIAYGTDSFDENRVRPLDLDWRAYYYNKPFGGVWASPAESKCDWLDYCAGENFAQDSLSKHFMFHIDDDADIFPLYRRFYQYYLIPLNKVKGLSDSEIDSLERYVKGYVVDWDKITKEYDGVYLPYESLGSPLFKSWDVESICVWNPDVIIPINENKFRKELIHQNANKVRFRNFDERWGTYNPKVKQSDEYSELNNLRNMNVYNNSSPLFNGNHPGILAQGDDEDDNTIAAKHYKGTIDSGIKGLKGKN